MKQRVCLSLVAESGQARDISITLTEAQSQFVIGSGADVDCRLGSPGVGARHCQLCYSEGAVRLQNFDETLGTLRNGMAVEGFTDVEEGDRLEIGDVAFVVRFQSEEEMPAAEISDLPVHTPVAPPPPLAGEGREGVPARMEPAAPVAPVASAKVDPPVPSAVPTAPASPAGGGAGSSRPSTWSRPAGAAPAKPYSASGLSGAGRSGSAPVRMPPSGAARVPVGRDTPDPRGSRGTVVSGASRLGDGFVQRAIDELSAKYPQYVSSRGRPDLQQWAARGRETARKLGFSADEEFIQFLQCALLLNDDLTELTARNSDVWYTLTNTAQPGAMRLKRALRIVEKRMEKRPAETPKPRPVTASPADETQAASTPGPGMMPGGGGSGAMGSHGIGSRGAGSRGVGSRGTGSQGAIGSRAGAGWGAQATRATPPPETEMGGDGDFGPLPEIEGFTILGKLGAGGMANVYRARDTRLDIDVAIKVLRSLHPSAQEQFLLEARAAAKLQHPNIVQVLRYGQFGESGYYVMQLIQGKDGDQLIEIFRQQAAQMHTANEVLSAAGVDISAITPELRGSLNGTNPYYRMVACWIAGAADGLQRAHSEGVIHRDIKPKNLMLSRDGRMLVTDFGLATLRGEKTPGSAFCVGTPRYLSPEMLAGWASGSGTSLTDARVDIFGLGAALYEFLAFRPAYEGTVARVLRDIATSDPAPPRQFVWHVPEELEAICLKAMQRNPDGRYQKASEMADDLRNWLGDKSPDKKAKLFGFLKGSK